MFIPVLTFNSKFSKNYSFLFLFRFFFNFTAASRCQLSLRYNYIPPVARNPHTARPSRPRVLLVPVSTAEVPEGAAFLARQSLEES